MTQTMWNPWSVEHRGLFAEWMQAAKLFGILPAEFAWEDLLQMVDNAETLDLLDGMPRDKAILLAGLWMGRYQGNQDTGEWRQRVLRGTDLESIQLCCQEFLEVADEGTGQEFWTSLARLRVAVENIHPENIS